MPTRFRALLMLALGLLLTSCSVVDSIAPPPAATSVPTAKSSDPTPTPEPTLGDREYISAAYCWESHIDEGEFNLIRFFPSGNLIDIYAQPYTSCEDAWANTQDYLLEENLMQFNHGSYHLSGTWIVFDLAAPNSDKVSGEVKGEYAVDTLRLYRVGADPRDYTIVYQGE
ncbi:hypothetical protein KQH62_00035 [bacterium]|nr:hypothetical protein [bacterium]